jgi:TolB-like protein
MSLYQELNRRNVFRVAAAYAVAAWLLVQIAETIFPLFGYGDAPARIVVIVLGIGFLPAIIFAWVFEITPEGLKREADIERDQGVTPAAGKKLDRITMAVLAVALAYFAFDKFVLDPQRDIDMAESAARAGAEQAREEARLDMFSDKSIAVLPFVNRSAKEEDEYFTDGMHDELLTRLSRISALKVISRTSMMRYRETEKSIPEIGKELSVATVLEGGVQRSGNQVRINVQLIRSSRSHSRRRCHRQREPGYTSCQRPAWMLITAIYEAASRWPCARAKVCNRRFPNSRRRPRSIPTSHSHGLALPIPCTCCLKSALTIGPSTRKDMRQPRRRPWR